MSRSGYLRALGLNTPIRSVVDLKAVSDLAKVNGDLGRAAGLLKLWLVKRPGVGIRPINLDALISDFRTLQSQIFNLMSQIVNNKK